MTHKLWQKSSGTKLHPLLEAYTVGDDPMLDLRLLPFDIAASMAHAKGLRAIGMLTAKEAALLLTALKKLRHEAEKGQVTITVQDEDCHTVIENFLIAELGDLGKKIHTGRSRNDQVLVALRLFLRDALASIGAAAAELAGQFLTKAKRHQWVPFPGYSHTQQAMLSSLGHYYGSFTESLLDDLDLLNAIKKHIDANPLGSAAGFGVALPLDRNGTTATLGFSRLQLNALYCQASRGKCESVFLEALVQMMLTLGRFATDMLFFTSQECGYFHADDTLVTGSSIMPQKRNLDGLEILRGSVRVIVHHQHGIQDIAACLLSGYNRDLQLLKKPLIESVDICMKSIAIASLYLEGLTPDEENICRKITPGIFLADVATAMAKEKGIPFRDAYRLAAQAPPASHDLRENIRSKISLGAPGNLQLGRYAQRLKRFRNHGSHA